MLSIPVDQPEQNPSQIRDIDELLHDRAPNLTDDFYKKVDSGNLTEPVDLDIVRLTVAGYGERFDSTLQSAYYFLGIPTDVLMLDGGTEEEKPENQEPSFSSSAEGFVWFSNAIKEELGAAHVDLNLVTTDEIKIAYADISETLRLQLSQKADRMHSLLNEFGSDEDVIEKELQQRQQEHLQTQLLGKLHKLGETAIDKRSALTRHITKGRGNTPQEWERFAQTYIHRFKPRTIDDITDEYARSAIFYFGRTLFGEEPLKFRTLSNGAEDLLYLDAWQVRHDMDPTRPLTPQEWAQRQLRKYIGFKLFDPKSDWSERINTAIKDKAQGSWYSNDRQYRGSQYGYQHQEEQSTDSFTRPERPKMPEESGIKLDFGQQRVFNRFLTSVDSLKLDEELREHKQSFKEHIKREIADLTGSETGEAEAIRKVMKKLIVELHPDKVGTSDRKKTLTLILAQNVRAAFADKKTD